MTSLISLATLVILVGANFFTYQLVSKKFKGKTFRAAVITIVSWVIGLAAGIWSVSNLWAPATKAVYKLLASPVLSAYPLITSLCLAMVFLVAIWTGWAFLKVWFKEVFKESKIFFLFTVLAIFASCFTVIYLTGIATSYAGAWHWSYRITLALVFALLGLVFTRWWFPTGQNVLGVASTYVFCCLATTYLASALGWSLFANIKGSVYSISAFLLFNSMIFWLSYVLGDPKKKMKKRISYWLVVPWTLALTLICGVIIVLQATGQLSWVEGEVARIVNESNQSVENLQRELKATGIGQEKRELDAAIMAKNEVIAIDRRDKIRNRLEDQEKIIRAEIALPAAEEKILTKVKNLFGASEPKNSPARDTALTRVTVTSEPKYLIRIYNGDTFYYKSSENFTIIENYGTGNSVTHIHNKSMYPGEERNFKFYNIPNAGVKIYIAGDRRALFEFSYRITGTI